MIETSIPRPASLNKGLLITIVLAAVGYLNSFFAQSSMKEVMLRQGLPPEAVAQSGGMGFALLCSLGGPMRIPSPRAAASEEKTVWWVSGSTKTRLKLAFARS